MCFRTSSTMPATAPSQSPYGSRMRRLCGRHRYGGKGASCELCPYWVPATAGLHAVRSDCRIKVEFLPAALTCAVAFMVCGPESMHRCCDLWTEQGRSADGKANHRLRSRYSIDIQRRQIVSDCRLSRLVVHRRGASCYQVGPVSTRAWPPACSPAPRRGPARINYVEIAGSSGSIECRYAPGPDQGDSERPSSVGAVHQKETACRTIHHLSPRS